MIIQNASDFVTHWSSRYFENLIFCISVFPLFPILAAILNVASYLILFPAWVKIAQTAPITAPRNVGGGGGKVGTLTITWDVSTVQYLESIL